MATTERYLTKEGLAEILRDVADELDSLNINRPAGGVTPRHVYSAVTNGLERIIEKLED